MCLITKTTYTSCKHTKIFTDRTAYHTYYFRGAVVMDCKYARINVVKIDGVCAECLAGGVVAPKSKEEEGGEKDAIVEYQVKGTRWVDEES
jgi:hypothetical protein